MATKEEKPEAAIDQLRFSKRGGCTRQKGDQNEDNAKSVKNLVTIFEIFQGGNEMGDKKENQMKKLETAQTDVFYGDKIARVFENIKNKANPSSPRKPTTPKLKRIKHAQLKLSKVSQSNKISRYLIPKHNSTNHSTGGDHMTIRENFRQSENRDVLNHQEEDISAIVGQSALARDQIYLILSYLYFAKQPLMIFQLQKVIK